MTITADNMSKHYHATEPCKHCGETLRFRQSNGCVKCLRNRDDDEMVITLRQAVRKTRSAIGERVENRTGQHVWTVRWSFPTSELNQRDVLWLNGKPPVGDDPLSYFESPEVARLVLSAIELSRPVAVIFEKFEDASGFLRFWREV